MILLLFPFDVASTQLDISWFTHDVVDEANSKENVVDKINSEENVSDQVNSKEIVAR